MDDATLQKGLDRGVFLAQHLFKEKDRLVSTLLAHSTSIQKKLLACQLSTTFSQFISNCKKNPSLQAKEDFFRNINFFFPKKKSFFREHTLTEPEKQFLWELLSLEKSPLPTSTRYLQLCQLLENQGQYIDYCLTWLKEALLTLDQSLPLAYKRAIESAIPLLSSMQDCAKKQRIALASCDMQAFGRLCKEEAIAAANIKNSIAAKINAHAKRPLIRHRLLSALSAAALVLLLAQSALAEVSYFTNLPHRAEVSWQQSGKACIIITDNHADIKRAVKNTAENIQRLMEFKGYEVFEVNSFESFRRKLRTLNQSSGQKPEQIAIYFLGHGHPGYVDFSTTEKVTYLQFFVNSGLEGLSCKKFLFLDGCFTGGFADWLKSNPRYAFDGVCITSTTATTKSAVDNKDEQFIFSGAHTLLRLYKDKPKKERELSALNNMRAHLAETAKKYIRQIEQATFLKKASAPKTFLQTLGKGKPSEKDAPHSSEMVVYSRGTFTL